MNPVPPGLPSDIQDLAVCARKAAVVQFGNDKMKEFIRSILQHVRQNFVCIKHSEYFDICQPERADHEGGARVEVEAKTVIGFDESEPDSQNMVAEPYFTHNFYLLKGKPDVVCLIDATIKTVVFCAEGKKLPLSGVC